MASTMSSGPRTRLRRGASGEDGHQTHHFTRPRTEATRERAVFRYLYPWIEANQPASFNRAVFPHDAQAMPAPDSCPDTALAALAQLAAMRLKARRAFVTFLSTDIEYVLAEATKSMSLQYDSVENPKDHLWMGTCSFLRVEGLNDFAVEGWRKARRLREMPEDEDYFYTEGLSSHWFIVSDVRHNNNCNQRPFSRRAPWLRFFCSVPLRDLQGSVIGTLTVADDKPRYGVGASELTFMEDMADTITEHLEATIVKSQRQRSERLIQALALFNNGKDSLRHWWLGQDDRRLRRAGRYLAGDADTTQKQDSRMDKEFGTQDLSQASAGPQRVVKRPRFAGKDSASVATRSNSSAGNDRTIEHVAAQDFAAPTKEVQPQQPEFVGENSQEQKGEKGTSSTGRNAGSRPGSGLGSEPFPRPKPGLKRNPTFDLSEGIQGAYGRASNLIREALGAEGAVFIDASLAATNTRFLRKKSKSGTDDSSISSDSGGLPASSTSSNDNSDTGEQPQQESRTCRLNGFSTRNKSTLSGSHSDQHQFGLLESSLGSLIKRYPQGKIFNFEDGGDLYSSSEEGGMTTGSSEDPEFSRKRSSQHPRSRQSRDAKHLSKVMVGARTIAFYPLWDDASERWRTALFVWSSTPLRFFDPAEDITYLSAFGHSLIAELVRLETIASDKAKGTFISTISHELRSPLHGVLAGAEFLMESDLSPFQTQMASTICMAGRTLLDTVNHILDFSKISNATSRAQRKDRAMADASRHQGDVVASDDGEGEVVHVDLAKMTEEVVETVVSAYRFEGISKAASSGKPAESRRSEDGNDVDKAGSKATKQVAVSLDIAARDTWMVAITPGSWTRILTNLVGNALKYTREGTITVKLAAGEPSTDRGAERGLVSLTISDSGIGMTSQFMANGLYTPFKQADSHTTGTGLGLSIVKQIAKDLHADLEVHSELGRGTRVTLRFRARFATEGRGGSIASPDAKMFDVLRQRKVDRFHLYTRGDEASGSTNAGTIGASVLNTARQWLDDCETSSGLRMQDATQHTVCAIVESDLSWLAEKQPKQLAEMLADCSTQHAHMLILGRSMQSVSAKMSFEDYAVRPTFVHQPIGPRKLLRSIATAEDSITPLQARDWVLHELNSGARTPRTIKDARTEGSDFPWNKQDGPTPRRPSLSVAPDSEPSITTRAGRPTVRPVVTRGITSAVPQTARATSPPSPIQPIAAERLQPRMPDDEPHLGSGVLLVEDNEINMKLLVALMKKLHLEWECATNGQEALDAYTATPARFFLVLMDISMPVMDGFTSTMRIREMERKKKLPRCNIVALTGVTNSEARERAMNSGVDKYFTKPIRMKDLSVLVAETRI